MDDIRVWTVIILLFLLGIGLLAAKAFSFSMGWVLWPILIIAILALLFFIVLSSTKGIL